MLGCQLIGFWGGDWVMKVLTPEVMGRRSAFDTFLGGDGNGDGVSPKVSHVASSHASHHTLCPLQRPSDQGPEPLKLGVKQIFPPPNCFARLLGHSNRKLHNNFPQPQPYSGDWLTLLSTQIHPHLSHPFQRKERDAISLLRKSAILECTLLSS